MADPSRGLPTPVSEPVRVAAAKLREWLPERPVAYLVLGSGLGRITELVSSRVELPFRDLPGLPETTVAGHSGRFVAGRLGGLPVLIQAGRLHGYEGHGDELLGLPVQAAAEVGVRFAVLTNSVGALRPAFAPGSLALLADVLDLRASRSPSRTAARPPARAVFDSALSSRVEEVALELRIPLPRAVYAGVTGPSYETPAEVRMLRRLGADLVAMSVVAEVKAAGEVGLPVVGISAVANLASGLRAEGLEHREVVESGGRAAVSLGRLLVGVFERVVREKVTLSDPGFPPDPGAPARNG